jgi:CRP-like cAMP-binding protein
LLADVPESEHQRLLPHLQAVVLRKGQTLLAIGQRPSYVYFPVSALVSMLIDLPEGESVEAAALGRTDMVGIAALDVPSFYRASVRISGLAYQMPVHVLKHEEKHCPVYTHGVARFMDHFLARVALTLACSKHHSTDEQIIRLLLTTMDHSMTPVIQITQQEIADLLGLRREVVSLALQKFKKREEIKISRGSLEVLNRPALEKASCDCYWRGQESQRPV